MASFAMMILSPAVSAVAFSGTSYAISKVDDHGAEERKRANRAHAKLGKAEMEWSEDRQKKLDFYKFLSWWISLISTKQQLYIVNQLERRKRLFEISLCYLTFIIPVRSKRLVNYYSFLEY